MWWWEYLSLIALICSVKLKRLFKSKKERRGDRFVTNTESWNSHFGEWEGELIQCVLIN